MYKRFFKRPIDIIICLYALPIFLIIHTIFSFLIKSEDKGPVFYKARRIGKNSESFEMYKYRSMKVNSPVLLNNDGSTYNEEGDSRVTKVGKFMRESSLDEVPQILNVLKGEMSIIGPRASLVEVLATFKEDELDKMKVRPGITGYTQAYFRNELPNRDRRLTDSWYANNINFKLDFKILLRTLFTVIKKENIYTKK